jgi:YidC/Oxa1 family membrane protein insertase
MNIFSWLYTNLVYSPQVNLFVFLFNLTHDTGVSIVLLAVIVNLALWPIFANSYINTQKMKLLQPQLKKIQDKYKADPQESLKQSMAFNRKHGLNSGSIFTTLFVQLFFATGVYFVINDVTAGKSIVDYLYPFIASLPKTQLTTTAFGFIPIKASASSYIWLPFLSSVFSYLYGMYTFRWSPQLKVPAQPVVVKKADQDDKTAASALDPVALQKSMEFNTIYALPIFLFIFNFNLPTGLNIYFATVGLMSVLRQIFLINYYAGHTDKLLADIANSDPESDDHNPANNIDSLANPTDLAEQPIAVEFVPKNKPKSNKQNKPNKSNKKKK